jgi:hypothetical protein
MVKHPASVAARREIDERIDVAERPSSVVRAAAPPLAPVEDEVIDRDHLARMTFGEADLEREVLALFEQQAALLLQRMAAEAPSAVAAHAHILIGSARGIGAWKVATAAEAVERRAGKPASAALAEAMSELAVAVRQVQAAIAALLRSH